MEEFSVSVVMAPDRGRIAITPIPGRSGDFEADLAAVLAWRPDLVISLTTWAEFLEESGTALVFYLRRENIGWEHWPIADHGVPGPGSEAEWKRIARRTHRVLRADGRVLVHCRAGQGRSGMVAVRLLVEAGQPPDTALESVRKVRPHAVETEAQYNWAASAWGKE